MCVSVTRSEYVELGTTVTLNCTSRKIAWENIIYVIWKIHFTSRDNECIIAVGKNDSDHDTCQDGKQQKNTNGTYHLIIPNFSLQDEGSYTCDISYLTGGSLEIIKLTAFGKCALSVSLSCTLIIIVNILKILKWNEKNSVPRREPCGIPACIFTLYSHWQARSSSGVTYSLSIMSIKPWCY